MLINKIYNTTEQQLIITKHCNNLIIINKLIELGIKQNKL